MACLLLHDIPSANILASITRMKYRINPYHNFSHAVSMMVMLYQSFKFIDIDNKTIILAAAMGHDMGHRGLNNSYYSKAKHPLAILYNN